MADFSKYGVQPAPTPTVPTAVPVPSSSPTKTNIPTAVSAPIANTPVVSKFSKYGTPSTPVVSSTPDKKSGLFSLDTLKGETTYKADTETSNPLPNIVKVAGNIPSSAAKLARGVASPVNPLDTESPINIGANIVKGSIALKDLIKGDEVVGPDGKVTRNGGIINATKNLAAGIGDTALKIFKAPGEAYMDYLDNTGYSQKPDLKNLIKTSVTNPIEKISKIGIEDPLLIPSLLYSGPEGVATKEGKASDLISKFASPVTRGADTTIPTVVKKAKDFVTEMTAKSEATIESNILKSYEKGVKPGINVKMTPAKLADYRDDVVSAVKTIKGNKANLKFTDADGMEIVGENPKSLQQLSDSVEQTKKSIFKQYDGLAKTAGEAGIGVEMTPIASELDSVIGNKALAITSPKTIEYAQAVKDRLIRAGKLDAETAQEVIQNYNKSLEAFYRNPSYDTASQAAIDALLANRIRQALDEGISGLTGEQYGALKKQYGSLKAIEKDVIKASLRDARKNTKGLIDFTDILSGGQIVNGILSLNPAQIGSGLTQKAIAEYFKYLNNPNRAIEKMFNAAEGLDQPLIRANNLQKASDAIPKTNLPKNSIDPSLSQIDKNVNIPKKKGIIQKFKDTPNKEGGFIKIPFLEQGASSAEKGTMRDFMDLVSGEYKPDAKTAAQLKADAQDLASKYKFKSAFGGDRGLSSSFGKYLNRVKFNK